MFIGYSAPILDCKDTQIIVDAICTTGLKPALHVSFAYHVPKVVYVGAQKYVEFCEDDCELGAGRRLLHSLQETKTDVHMVAVTRWIGPDKIQPSTNQFLNLLHEILLRIRSFVSSLL